MKTWWYIVAWGYEEPPPAGKDRVLAWGRNRGEVDRELRDAVYAAARAKGAVPGDGYQLKVMYDPFEDYRVMSGKQVASMRRKRMETKMRKHYPMFADQMIETELRDNAEKYDVSACDRHQAEREARIEQLSIDLVEELPTECEVVLPGA